MIFALTVFLLGANDDHSNWLTETHYCMKSTVVEFEKSGEPAAIVADAALSKCDDFWLAYRKKMLENSSANSLLTREEAKQLLDDFWAETAEKERAAAIQTVVEIRAARATN